MSNSRNATVGYLRDVIYLCIVHTDVNICVCMLNVLFVSVLVPVLIASYCYRNSVRLSVYHTVCTHCTAVCILCDMGKINVINKILIKNWETEKIGLE